MIAGIESDNVASIRLHERFGFVEVARLPEIAPKFDRWLELVLLELLIR
jgi:phosphinothricin acetyltransferase